jgi:hypothetical protein
MSCVSLAAISTPRSPSTITHWPLARVKQMRRWPSANGSYVDMKGYSKRTNDFRLNTPSEPHTMACLRQSLLWGTSTKLESMFNQISRKQESGTKKRLPTGIRTRQGALMDSHVRRLCRGKTMRILHLPGSNPNTNKLSNRIRRHQCLHSLQCRNSDLWKCPIYPRFESIITLMETRNGLLQPHHTPRRMQCQAEDVQGLIILAISVQKFDPALLLVSIRT